MVDNTIWLLVTTLVALVAGGVSGWVSATARRREAKAERIRQEVLVWTNPILDSVKSLESRLKNILTDKLYLALDPSLAEKERPVKPDWAMDHDYAMESTLFVFAEYFAWMRLLQERLSFELFDSQEARKHFLDAVWDVSNEIGRLPLPAKFLKEELRDQLVGNQEDGHEDRDAQVFALQQRAIGEFLIDREADTPRVRGYPEFLAARELDERFNRVLAPLMILFEGVSPRSTKRWRRLEATRAALRKLEGECNHLLGHRQPVQPSSEAMVTQRRASDASERSARNATQSNDP